MNNDETLSHKTKAIGIIAYYTGMRASDIALLKLDSIDWNKNIITFVQKKTQTSNTLPLLPIVGNAIYDYIVKERPASDSPYIFLSNFTPHNPLSTRSLGYMCRSIFHRTNVRTENNQKKGFHLFRHHLATTMLSNDIVPSIITATLGHRSPSSIEKYLSADFKHLKDCALDINWIAMNNSNLIV